MRTSSATDIELGEELARAVAKGELGAAGDLLHPEVEFRALTPRRVWEAAGPGEVLDVLRTWFGSAEIERVDDVATGTVGERHHVAYRFRGRRDGAPFVIEQQAYFSVREGRIDWMRLLCSGFEDPTAPSP